VVDGETSPLSRNKKRPSKPISIKDIARAAGVHHSTVSRALRDGPMVNGDTADRIRKIAKAAGFTVSAVARSLATQKTNLIGVVVTDITDPFHHEIISGLDKIAEENGYSVVLADSHGDPDRELRIVRSFHARRVDAIVVMSSRVGDRYMSQLSERNIPIVLMNSQRHGAGVNSVKIDNVQGAFAAVNHLIELGHKRIAYIGNRNRVYSDAERMTGYRRALEGANIKFSQEFVVHTEFSPEGGISAIRSLLSSNPTPTAVFCYNDMLAIGVLKAAREVIRVPQDLSVVGFDDLYIARYLEPALTTVMQPKWEMGQLVMKLTLKLLSGEKAEKTILVPGELIIRASTARCCE
jgi:DNA-binding LacI/PurR family transcriptional regulator